MSSNLSKIIRAIIIFGIQFSPGVMASDNNALMAFARTNAEKFKNEIVETKGIKLGSKITVLGVVGEVEFMYFGANYIPDDGELVIGSTVARLNHLMIYESCEPAGSFIGQNSYGAKTTVRRQKCERLFVRDGDPLAVRIAGSRIKMTPSQFREINRSGVKVELDLVVGHPNKNTAVSYSESIDSATLKYPIESHMRVWSVDGRVKEVRWILPGGTQPTQIWRRE